MRPEAVAGGCRGGALATSPGERRILDEQKVESLVAHTLPEMGKDLGGESIGVARVVPESGAARTGPRPRGGEKRPGGSSEGARPFPPEPRARRSRARSIVRRGLPGTCTPPAD